MNNKFLGPSKFYFFFHNIILIIIEMTAIQFFYIIFLSNLKKIKIFCIQLYKILNLSFVDPYFDLYIFKSLKCILNI